MNTQKTIVAALLILGSLGVVAAVNGTRRASADVFSDCVGKPYGTAGCPLKSSSSSTSSVSPMCGNGVVDPGEECDNGRFNGVSNCTKQCTLLYCGDGIISPQLGEECEPDSEEVYAIDPNTNQLTTEIHYLQRSCGTICTVPTCDASGTCTGGCQWKFLPACPVNDSQTLSSNTGATFAESLSSKSSVAFSAASSSSITSSAQSASSQSAASTASVAVSHCGNGILENGEQCDLGPNNSNAPNAQCRLNCTLPKCGDGTTDTQRGEQCDDGANNTNNPGGHCRMDCTLARCGDGVVDPGEECDDGPSNSNASGAHCSMNCKLPKCGDGIVQDGEQCDLGPNNSDTPNAQCRTDCQKPSCGDGIIDTTRGEQCDDGVNNGKPGDPCGINCLLPKCGDGIIQSNEQCDDGVNNSDTEPDACRTNCTVAHCGDGVVDTGEQCDDGAKNGTAGDSCSLHCDLLKSAVPSILGQTGGISPLSPIVLGLGGFGFLGVLAYILRRYLHTFVKKIAGEKVARSIDDIPLDEIELPWLRH